jgi:adenine-specific DNA-methyltransferase
MTDTSQIQKIDLNKTDWRSSRDFFQSLEDELRNLDDKDEKYDFTWVGKRKAIIEAGAPINKTLRPDEKSSKNWDSTENLFIEGDNLDALKLLQESYLGKVKMIYIDPPYNTGKDFVYHDNFKANVEEYDEATEYKDEEGNIQFKKNEKSNGRYHSDWLSMMYPRLKLARNLLSDDGVIFISIGVDESENLAKLSDEIYGEDNRIGIVPVIMNLKGNQDAYGFAETHDYVLVYARNKVSCDFGRLNVSDEELDDWLEDEHGIYKVADNLRATGVNAPRSKRPNLWYPIFMTKNDELYVTADNNPSDPNDEIVWPLNPENQELSWYWGKPTFNENKQNLIIKRTSNGTQFYRKQRPQLGDEGPTKKPKSVLFKPDYSSSTATTKLKELMDGKLFDSPKPVPYIKDLLSMGSLNNSMIVDFFSGSGTTAHAVMQLNAEDGGNRKWIMIQLPEETPEGSESRKAGFATIPEIARERIRRAGDKIAKEFPDAKVDYGFRSLVIADTNYKEVYKPVSEISQESLLDTVDNIKEDRSELDLLYGVLTQLALELNRPLETREIAGSKVYLYDYLGEVSGLVACFSKSVSEEAIKHIAGLKPLTAVFRDSSFADSQAKVNLAEHFRVISPDTKVRVI